MRLAYFELAVRHGDNRDRVSRQISVPCTAALLDLHSEPDLVTKDMDELFHALRGKMPALNMDPDAGHLLIVLALNANEHKLNPLRDPMVPIATPISLPNFCLMLAPLGFDKDWVVDIAEHAVSMGYTAEQIFKVNVSLFLDEIFFETIMNLAIRLVLNARRSISHVLMLGVVLFLEEFEGAQDDIRQGITAGDAWLKMTDKLACRDETDEKHPKVLRRMLKAHC